VRIVSLCPSITETLIDFGLADALVGITRYCIRPRDVTRRLSKVGGTKNPDLDAIRRAEPDLVFVNEEENTKADFEILSREFRVDASFPRRVSDVPALLRHFGRLTDRTDVAETRATALEAALADLASAQRDPFAFAYLVWRDPWMTVNADTYVSDLFARAGGTNVFGAASERYPTTTLSDLRDRAPELVLLPDEPFHFRARDRDEVLAALPRARIELVSGDDCCWHGVRSIAGVALVRTFSETRARPG
jgi:ABC-type Fe3+-hydroxamate transport system substrate-binding protein